MNLFEGYSDFSSHAIVVFSISVLLCLSLPVTKGDPLYDANEYVYGCGKSDEVSFLIMIFPEFETL